MSTDIYADWAELGERISGGIDTLGTVEGDQVRINAKINGLQGARTCYQSLSPEQYFDASKVWEDFRDLLRARITDFKVEADRNASRTDRKNPQGYVQGLELALDYTRGFGR